MANHRRPLQIDTPSASTLVDLDAMAAEAPKPRQVSLFTLNGVDYLIDAEPDASLVLQYLLIVSSRGQEAASAILLQGVLGEEAYQALMNYKGLTMGMLSAVMKAVQTHVLGSAETAGGIGVPLG
jgi:hypothetical protein